MGQTAGQEYKTKGLDFLRSNKNDSALIYLDMAIDAGVKDGKVLGGLALIYIQMGNQKKALSYARGARNQKETVTADAYIAGVLGNEQLGKIRQRNYWLNQGLKLFPEDYLLLYHAGRIKIPFNSKEGEMYLLRSVYAAPWFAESHYLLGEQMFRRGENLKAALPLFYFLLLENSTERSKETVLNLERLYQAWATSNKGISKISRVSQGFTIDFTPEQTDFKPIDYSARSRWFVKQSFDLMNTLDKTKISSDDILWEFYSHFFSKAAQLGHAKALSWHMTNGLFPAEVMEWIASNGLQYKDMADWLSIQ